MALIACPDCGKQASDAAAACIHCGRPLARTTADSVGTDAHPVLIEQSSKRWKLGMIMGVGVALLGFVVAAQGSGAGGLILLVLGVLTFLFSVVANWWNHG